MDTDQAGINHTYNEAQKHENLCNIFNFLSNTIVVNHIKSATINKSDDEIQIKAKKVKDINLFVMLLFLSNYY